MMTEMDYAAMALMDQMSRDGYEVSIIKCREYVALTVAALGSTQPKEASHE